MKNIKRISIVIFISVFSVSVLKGQETKKVYQISDKYYRLILVSDSQLPITIASPEVIKYKNGSFDRVFKIENTSNKSVASFQIKHINWFGNKELTNNFESPSKNEFLPYESFSSLGNTSIEYLGYKDDFPELSVKLKRVWVVMVTKVTLFDGGFYDNTKKYEKIEKFIKGLNINYGMSKKQLSEKEKQLDDAINEIMR